MHGTRAATGTEPASMRRASRFPMRAIYALALSLVLVACRGDESTSVAPSAPQAPATVQTNAPAAPAARADSVTVVFFGDSLTEGYGLAGGKAQAYPALISERAREDGIPLRIVNAGVSGNTSAEGRARVDWTLARSSPDVFVLALGANDGLRGLPPEAMHENLRAILEAVRRAAPAAQIVIAGMEAPPNYGADYTSRFRAVFPSLAAEFDAALLPFLLDGVAGVPALNQRDGVHPTAAGHEAIAELMWVALEGVVSEE